MARADSSSHPWGTESCLRVGDAAALLRTSCRLAFAADGGAASVTLPWVLNSLLLWAFIRFFGWS